MFCVECGKKLAENATFCTSCGRKVDKEDLVKLKEPDINNKENIENENKKTDSVSADKTEEKINLIKTEFPESTERKEEAALTEASKTEKIQIKNIPGIHLKNPEQANVSRQKKEEISEKIKVTEHTENTEKEISAKTVKLEKDETAAVREKASEKKTKAGFEAKNENPVKINLKENKDKMRAEKENSKIQEKQEPAAEIKNKDAAIIKDYINNAKYKSNAGSDESKEQSVKSRIDSTKNTSAAYSDNIKNANTAMNKAETAKKTETVKKPENINRAENVKKPENINKNENINKPEKSSINNNASVKNTGINTPIKPDISNTKLNKPEAEANVIKNNIEKPDGYKTQTNLKKDTDFLQNSFDKINEGLDYISLSRKRENEIRSINVLTDRFISEKEEIKSVLGEKNINSLINTSKLSKGYAVLTDKRLYYSGDGYSKTNGKTSRIKQDTIIENSDITGTYFRYSGHSGFITAGIFAAFGAMISHFISRIFVTTPLMTILYVLAAIISAGLYFSIKRNEYTVIFKGGELTINASHYSPEEIKAFDRKIHKIISEEKNKN